uniref:FACT complex subunit n=1 Tax=Ascaris lumbricoides TaxID=6252 RepID=A0A9J2Q690_ASCLU
MSKLKEGKDESLSTVDALVFMVGSDEDASQYSKSNALQFWLYNYELNDTLTLFTKQGFYFLASTRKAQFLQPVENKEAVGSLPPVTVVVREKSDKDRANMQKFASILKEAGEVFGYFGKDSFSSDFAKSWNAILEENNIKLTVDVSTSFAHLFAKKDSTEIEQCKKAAAASVNTWSFLRKKIVDIIDQSKKVKHSRLAEDVEKAMTTVQVQQRLADNGNVESCYTPIIQSGGNFSLKLSAESNDKLIHYGTIVYSLGARYQSYCSNVSRTMLVDPSKELEENYEILLVVENAIIEALKPGAKLSDVYAVGINALKEKKPALMENLIKNNFGPKCEMIVEPNMVFVVYVGLQGLTNSEAKDEQSKTSALLLSDTVLISAFGGEFESVCCHQKYPRFLTGLEFRESSMLISPKCEMIVEPNMVFVVYVGLQGLTNSEAKDEQSKTSALLLSDTVLISAEGANEILTERAKSRLKSNVIRFKEEPETSHGDDNKENNAADVGRGKRSVLLQDQTRNKTTNEDKRKEHQKELAKRLNEAAKERLAEQTGQKDTKTIKKSNVSYKAYEKFPKEPEVDKLNIYVDRRHDSIILPIFGVPVPFHISMIKNTSQSVEGDFTYLRVNFMHPGSQIGKDSQQQFPHPLSTYVKELFNVTAYFVMEAEEREKEGAVKQDKLILSTAKGNPKLKDLFVRPNIIAKRVSGSLEAHANGFRYTSLRGDKIDVLYNNIKHAFFQPCDNEMIILLHFTLKNPVLWGKRKYQDIQFYTEVGEITTDLGKYHHMQDRDDIQSEQMEREMRKKLNQVFQNFCDKARSLRLSTFPIRKIKELVKGFRYTSLRGDKIDVLYNNIKHAFFQPCDNEMIILLHFTLKNPVLWGKRKYQDIQFYTEVGEITTDLGKYHHMQDRDDIQSEQMEREMRKKLNQVFQNFCDKVVRQTNEAFDFDSPFNELGFFGVPHRSSCTLKPTSACLVNLTEWNLRGITLCGEVFNNSNCSDFRRVHCGVMLGDREREGGGSPFNELGFFGVPHRSSCTLKPTSACLVNLTEWPPFVITLDEVEFVHFERVSFQLKNFDMVFIFKDYTRKVQMVQQIPMTSLDNVKEWLNSCDIHYSEGIQSLNWAKIMKTILDDPEDFFQNDGWNFLATDSDNEDEEEDEESEEAWTPSEEESEGEDEDEDEEESDEVTSESGKDWSDLEAEAQRADRARDRGEEERVHREKARHHGGEKRKHSSKGRGPSPKRRK